MVKDFGEFYDSLGSRVTNDNFQNLNLQVDENNGIYFFWKPKVKVNVKGEPVIFVSVISNNGSETVFQKIQLIKQNTPANLIENLNTTFNSNNNKEPKLNAYYTTQSKIQSSMTKFWNTVEKGKYRGYKMSGINMKKLRAQNPHNAEEPNNADVSQ